VGILAEEGIRAAQELACRVVRRNQEAERTWAVVGGIQVVKDKQATEGTLVTEDRLAERTLAVAHTWEAVQDTWAATSLAAEHTWAVVEHT